MKNSYYAIKNITTDSIVKDKTDMPWLFTETEEDIVDMLVNHYNNTGRDLHCNEGEFKKIIVDIIEKQDKEEDVSLNLKSGIKEIKIKDTNDKLSLGDSKPVTSLFELTAIEEPFSFSPCQNCSNNPKNGGSGICNCTLGLPKMSWLN